MKQCQYYTWHARPPGDYLGQVGKALGAGCGRKGAPVIKHGSQFLVTRWSFGHRGAPDKGFDGFWMSIKLTIFIQHGGVVLNSSLFESLWEDPFERTNISVTNGHSPCL